MVYYLYKKVEKDLTNLIKGIKMRGTIYLRYFIESEYKRKRIEYDGKKARLGKEPYHRIGSKK
jgi:hypothetical protein